MRVVICYSSSHEHLKSGLDEVRVVLRYSASHEQLK